mgnify:CR=1 FL=1
MRDNDLQLHQAWRHVTANLRDLDLVSFAGAGKGAYKITAVGTSPEESTQFLIDVGNSITNATITLDSINQDSESVNFVFLLKFNE